MKMKIESVKLANAVRLVHSDADWANSYRSFAVKNCDKQEGLLTIDCSEKPLVAFIFNNSSQLHIICKKDDKYIPYTINMIELIGHDYDYFGKIVNDNYDIVFYYDNEYGKRLKNIGIHNIVEDAVYFV